MPDKGLTNDIANQLELLRYMARESLDIELTDAHLIQFSVYIDLLLEWNERINLTAITEPGDIIIKHFLDSLVFVKWLEKYYPQQQEILLGDLGTGAGFPGIPIKILLPRINVVLIDALAKRINFLNKVSLSLNLLGVETYHARAEDFGRDLKYRGTFDLIVARAVAGLPVLLEYSSPLLKVGGRFFAAKGLDPESEILAAQKAMQILNCEVEYFAKYRLADGADYRSLLIIKKTGPTPGKYPRQAGKPKRNPL